MTQSEAYRRYAVYHTPEGALGQFGAAWLGWDIATGAPVQQSQVDSLDMSAITDAPRCYGFHATMKAPFRLRDGHAPANLLDAMRDIARSEPPVCLQGGLRLARVGGFLALLPTRESAALATLEARLVRDLDPFRAPLTDAEITRRQPDRLSARQREYLTRWGYPYVLEDFRFHITLTGELGTADSALVEAALRLRLNGLLDDPYVLSSLTLAGEDDDGCFHEVARAALIG